MSALVQTTIADSIATIVMDDGKANVMSLGMQSALHDALDQAQSAEAVVVLTSARKLFSGGFDLAVITEAGREMAAMLTGGFELSARLLAFPTPVITASPGHAVAMGVFLFMSSDYSIGANGPFKYVANEVAIGMTMPRAPIEVMRNRLTPSGFTRVSLLAEALTPEQAQHIGLIDELAEPDQVGAVAQAAASRFATLNKVAHRQSKLRARESLLSALDAAIAADSADVDAMLTAAGR
jgi:enoyl-CoA hydratase